MLDAAGLSVVGATPPPSPSPSPNPNPNPNPIRNTYQVSKLGEEKLVLRERIARKDPP